MRVSVVYGAHVMDHHRYWGAAFEEGLRAAGQASVSAGDADWREDLAVFWGHGRADVIAEVKAAGGHYLVMERGYVGDRYRWTSLGFDGLNGRAVFPGRAGAAPDRWEQLRPRVNNAPRAHSTRVVIAGQVAGDAALQGQSLRDWYQRQVDTVKAMGLVPVFRPHPESRHWDGPSGCDVSYRGLEEDLGGARAVVTFNSNLGVDAALAGCVVVATDPGSMAWDVAYHDVADLSRIDECVAARDLRQFSAWCHGMAYSQWSHEEISAGTAWNKIRSFYEPSSHG